MKKQIVLLLFCLTLSFFIHSQNIINVSKNLKLPDTYSTLQSAVTAASAGDTIHIHPYVTDYGGATITKKLTIIGVGYDFLQQSDSLGIETFLHNSKLTTVTFSSGSDSSVIMGCEATRIYVNGTAKYVRIIRNKINWNISVTDADSITIHGCYLPDGNGYSPYYTISIGSSSQGIICTNNIMSSTSGRQNINVDASSDALIQRNIMMRGDNNIQNSIIVDNIINAGTFSSQSSVVTNNIFTQNLIQYATDNIINYGTSGIFVGYPDQLTYSFDDRWKLAPGSPAIGYAFDGGDCGVYSGDYPYKLSGIPAIPLIYELNPMETVIIENDSLHLNVKIRSEN